MITTSKEPKYSYLRRISGLVLMIFSVAALTLTIQKVQAQSGQTTKEKTESKTDKVITFEADTVLWNTNKDEVVATTPSGEKIKIRNIPVNKGKIIIDNNIISKGSGGSTLSLPTGENAPLCLWDGKEIDEKEMKERDPNTIASVTVLKGGEATALYGDKGKNGVIIVTSNGKAGASDLKGAVSGVKVQRSEGTGSLKEVVVTGYGVQKHAPAIFIDGVEGTQEQLDALNTTTIESVNVLKGESAIQKYGAKGTNGAIEITTKKEGAVEITSKPAKEDFDKVFTRVEQPAQFPGGENAWKQYLERNMIYPEAAQKAGTEGVAQLQFIVNTKGEISNVKIMKDPGNGIGEAAAALIKKGPKWNPAMQNGKPVVLQMQLSIPFKLG